MKAALLLVAAMVAALQIPVRSQTATLPPISYVCPMPQDAEIVETKPGKCPKCGMQLIPVRLETVWTCPVHSVITEPKPGKCPIDQRDLIPVTMQLSWTCPGQPDAASPGKCPDGTPRAKKYSPRAHGNHNPQHGGQFFMAPDNWHHLEGAYLRNGVFRLYLYDDFTKPLTVAKVRAVTARVVTKQTFDPATRTTKEITALPLVRNGRYLEARIGALPLPAQMSAKVRFEPGMPENLFDFTFDSYTKEDAGAPRVTTTAPAPAPPISASAVAKTPDPLAAPDPGTTATLAAAIDPALVPTPIPDTIPEMVAQLGVRNDQIRGLIERGSFGGVYVPAFQAKDLALALDAHVNELPPERQKIAGPAIASLVRSAYLLDAFGDLGNRQQIGDAYVVFAAAVKDIESVFPGGKQP